MRATTLKGETSVGALVDRFFVDLTPETRQTVESALLKANPHLARPDAFKAGTVVRLPEIAGARIKATAAGQDPRAELIGGLREAVSAYRARLAAGLESENGDIKAQLDLLKQREVTALLKELPAAEELAAGLADSLKQSAKTLPQEKKLIDEAFARIEADLSSLT